MSEITITRLTGHILSLGDGAVGKTTLTMNLTDELTTDDVIRKTKNLEFEFFCDTIKTDAVVFKIQQHFFTPPGQKEAEGDKTSRSYETVIELYRDLISIPQVVLLVYDLSNLESFNNLEFWVEQAIQLMDEKTEYILVGTHLDAVNRAAVNDEVIFNGIRYIEKSIRQVLPGWQGMCQHVEISSKTNANIAVLRRLISQNLLRIRRITLVEEAVFSQISA